MLIGWFGGLNDSRLSDHTLLEIQTRFSKKCKHFSEFRRTMKAEAPDLEDLNKYDFRKRYLGQAKFRKEGFLHFLKEFEIPEKDQRYFQMHHVIERNLGNSSDFSSFFTKIGFDVNDPVNSLPL